MKWMRPDHIRKDPKNVYHLPQEGRVCSQDTHYFGTLCRTEIKYPYDQWDIKENPPKEECCKKCLSILINRT